jgi:hypothetical protein
MASEKKRYSDEELEEFRNIINEKLKVARANYEEMMAQQDNDGNSTNQTQREFVDKRHAPCHTIVLHEIYKEPVCNTNRLTKAKVGLDI